MWLVLLGLWCPALASLAEENAAASTVAWVGGVLAGVAAAATLAFGARLGHRRLWRPAAVACLAGAGVLLFWFATITVTAPDPTNQNDHAVGIGVVLLAVPSVVVVGIILGVGACAGCGYRRLRSRVTR